MELGRDEKISFTRTKKIIENLIKIYERKYFYDANIMKSLISLKKVLHSAVEYDDKNIREIDLLMVALVLKEINNNLTNKN
jgi:hypothetical protein